jgi:phosphate starvation-inducible PhoH-like protein
MRGRTLKNAFIILDEAQNTTTEQMLMFLTRLGEGSRCVITGDPSQVDLRRSVRSGLREAVEVLQAVEGVQFIHFLPKDIVRLPVVQRIIEAYHAARSVPV